MTHKEPNPRHGLTLYQISTITMNTSLPRKISTNSQNDDLGITLSTSLQVSNQSIARPIPYPRKNKNILRNLSTRIFAPDELSHHLHPWHHHSFCQKERWKAMPYSRSSKSK